jgi:hypothetical protein
MWWSQENKSFVFARQYSHWKLAKQNLLFLEIWSRRGEGLCVSFSLVQNPLDEMFGV